MEFVINFWSAMESNCIKSTGLTPLRQCGKGSRKELGSDSSVDGELSYLDTGHVTRSKDTSSEKLPLTHSQYDAMMSKLILLENGLSKLDKLDKLDEIEQTMKYMNVKLVDVENRLNATENTTKDLQESVSFVSNQYDKLVSHGDSSGLNLKTCEKDMHKLIKENSKLKQCLYELDLSSIPFERVHRTKPKRNFNNHNESSRNDDPSPIIAKFTYFKDRKLVRKSGHL